MTAFRGPRAWVVLGILVAVVLTAATYLLVISPARAETASVQSQVEDASLQQATLRHRLRDLGTAAADMDALRAQVAAAQDALPATADTAGLLRRVQAVAAAAGARVDQVTVKSATTSPVAGVWAVPVDVALVGTPEQLLAALAALQATGDSRLVTVASSSLAIAAGDMPKLSLTVAVYATTEPTGATAATSGAAGAGAGATGAGAAGAVTGGATTGGATSGAGASGGAAAN